MNINNSYAKACIVMYKIQAVQFSSIKFYVIGLYKALEIITNSKFKGSLYGSELLLENYPGTYLSDAFSNKVEWDSLYSLWSVFNGSDTEMTADNTISPKEEELVSELKVADAQGKCLHNEKSSLIAAKTFRINVSRDLQLF